MSRTSMRDFDVAALFAALDAQRQSRRLTWAGVLREISPQFAGIRSRPIAGSTIVGMRGRRAVEGDGVLQMLRWLDRTPESFVPGHPAPADSRFALPPVPTHQILRFDTKAIYAALDAARAARGLTWAEVARDIGGVNPAGLTRYAKGGRTAFPQVMRIAAWLDVPTSTLTGAAAW